MMILLMLVGCTSSIFFPPSFEDEWWDSGRWDSGRDRRDTGDDGEVPNPGPGNVKKGLEVTATTGACDADGAAWTITARTDGWTSIATVHLIRTADLVYEEHPLELVASDPAGGWDELRAGPLLAGVQPDYQVPGESTRFGCGLDAREITYVIRVWEPTVHLADCVVQGADPAGATALIRELDPEVTALGGCRVLDP